MNSRPRDQLQRQIC